jgi:transcription elongation factor SPT6
MATLFDLDAQVGSEEDDDYDEETGEARQKAIRAEGVDGKLEDSSEEEDDDDEEAERQVREGFIVDEEEEDEGERRRRRRERKKRRREEREEEDLDDEDLDLIGALDGPAKAESKFKRLKRGHREEGERGIDDIFADEDDEPDGRHPQRTAREIAGEFDDFIEEDELDEDRDRQLEDLEVSRRPKTGLAGIVGMSATALDEQELEDMRAAFGDGTEYDWALQLQEAMDDEQLDPEKPLELKDVFEPSQLAEKMLTDADNHIRSTDVPERFQLARKPFADVELSEDEIAARSQEEATWISNMLWPKKRLDPDLKEPFQKSIGHILDFMNVEDYEVPFIFQHRKDYLIHAVRISKPDPDNPTLPQYKVEAEKLLTLDDLWEIFELDMKYKAFAEKRDALRKTFKAVQDHSPNQDDIVDDMLEAAVTMEEVQDIQDYVHFQYSAELKDVNIINAETTGALKRARATTGIYEKMRASRAYSVVKAFGTTADALAQSVLETRRSYTDDATQRPDDMADDAIGDDYSTGSQVLRAAKAMFAEELTMSPRMRKLLRQTYYRQGHIDCVRTDKGLRKITEDHRYFEFKYLRNQSIPVIAARPELYLRMLKAEEEGLLEVHIRLEDESRFVRNLKKSFESDNFSEVADAWNVARREVLDMALSKLKKIMVKGVKENLRTECENQVAKRCREAFSKKLDQAPYKPRGMQLGTEPHVLAMSNGNGGSKDAIIWAYVEANGRCLENGKYSDLRLGDPERSRPQGADVISFVEVVERRKPDVIAISGFSTETRALQRDLQAIIDQADLRGTEYTDDDDRDVRDKIEVVIVNDEVARLYQNSDRSAIDYPGFAPLTRYCVALAKYMQNPLKEYANLRRDITSVTFDPNQNLIPQEKLQKQLETALVDMVNLVGVDINDAVNSTYTAALLPYVCGLGPRKAQALLQVVNRNGGQLTTREELVGDPETNKLQAVGPKVWSNCASFLFIDYDKQEAAADYLDNTRVHPEDYELGRKMAADALEIDEEDVKAEVEEYGPGAIVRKLIDDNQQDKVNDLILELYAEQLEVNFNQRKRATLETIRAELQSPYEELRRDFQDLDKKEIFSMLTGETDDSLVDGMIVSVAIRRAFPDHIECRLDCGIEGTVPSTHFPGGMGMGGLEPRNVYQPHQTIQAKVFDIDRKRFSAQLSLREDDLRKPFRRDIEHSPGEWDYAQEEADKRAADRRQEDVTGRAQRVIKHPLFRPFNALQAEEYLGPQSRGDIVIRPSSKGLDHLTITWKVADNVFQHIDVLELDKENEFSVGRTLKIGGKYTYSDLDELIVNHVKAMAKKVEEIMQDDRYQNNGKPQTGWSSSNVRNEHILIYELEQWLTAYMEANPKRAMYAFCINREYPGYFYLCFKASASQPPGSWSIKVVPNAFELQKNAYVLLSLPSTKVC